MFSNARVDQVYLALGATDLRKSVDGLALIVQEQFKLSPFSRNLYVFCNRKRDKIKILEWYTFLLTKASEERYMLRIEKIKPILDDLLLWLKTERKRTLPKSKLGEAIKYS